MCGGPYGRIKKWRLFGPVKAQHKRKNGPPADKTDLTTFCNMLNIHI